MPRCRSTRLIHGRVHESNDRSLLRVKIDAFVQGRWLEPHRRRERPVRARATGRLAGRLRALRPVRQPVAAAAAERASVNPVEAQDQDRHYAAHSSVTSRGSLPLEPRLPACCRKTETVRPGPESGSAKEPEPPQRLLRGYADAEHVAGPAARAICASGGRRERPEVLRWRSWRLRRRRVRRQSRWSGASAAASLRTAPGAVHGASCGRGQGTATSAAVPNAASLIGSGPIPAQVADATLLTPSATARGRNPGAGDRVGVPLRQIRRNGSAESHSG